MGELAREPIEIAKAARAGSKDIIKRGDDETIISKITGNDKLRHCHLR
jgi:hypothetical protein